MEQKLYRISFSVPVGLRLELATENFIPVFFVLGGPLQVTVRPMLGPLFCLSVSLFVTLVYCGQTVDMDQDATGVEVVLGDADPAPTRKGARQPPPHFSACVYCGETVAHLNNC